MTPNELRLANLTATISTARATNADPISAAYAQLPPVPADHTFQDYARYVGLGDPMSIMMTDDQRLLRDAINRKYAVFKGASPRDPNARYQNFAPANNLVPNFIAANGLSMLDTLASIGSIASRATPLGDNLRNWAESGDLRRDINEMYQTSLGRIDQEHQTNPKGRAEIHARDEVASFLGQLLTDRVTAPRALLGGAKSMASTGMDHLERMLAAKNAVDVVDAELTARTTPDTSVNDLRDILRELKSYGDTPRAPSLK